MFCFEKLDSPLNCDAGNLIRMEDMRGFNSLAKMYTLEYAQEGIPISLRRTSSTH